MALGWDQGVLLYESDDSLSVAEEHFAKFHLKWSLLGKNSGGSAKPPAGLLTGLTLELKQAVCSVHTVCSVCKFSIYVGITDYQLHLPKQDL